MGWVTLAMTKIIDVTLEIPTIVFIKGRIFPVLVKKGLDVFSVYDIETIMNWPILGDAIIPAKATGIIICLVIAAFYTAISGLWGVMATDLFQFSFAMTGTIILMVIVFVVADGPKNLVEKAHQSVMQGGVINKTPFARDQVSPQQLYEKTGYQYNRLKKDVVKKTASDTGESLHQVIDNSITVVQNMVLGSFDNSDKIDDLISDGIFATGDSNDSMLYWTADNLSESELTSKLAPPYPESLRNGVIQLWKDSYTIGKIKFTSSKSVNQILNSGILIEDPETDYYRLKSVSMSNAEMSQILDESGLEDRSEIMAAMRKDQVVSTYKITNFLPPFDLKGGGLLAIWSLVVFLGLQWWAGGEGGGFLAQRLFSCKNEKHSVLAMLWFNVANFVLRPWPWIVVGIGSLFLIPDVTLYGSHYDQEHAYVIMLMKYLPVGLKGMMVAALMAAYMSTISTHVNFGASYVVNDLYKRFIDKNGSESRYIMVSQCVSIFLAMLAGLCAFFMKTIDQGWFLMFELMSGVGFVVLLRWYWWIISAWSELAAMFSSLLMFFLLNHTQCFHFLFSKFSIPIYFLDEYPIRFTMNLVCTTIFWIVVTVITPPEKEAHLIKFYKRVRPAGWWQHIALKAGNPNHLTVGIVEWICWGLGVTGLFALIASLGKLCFGMYLQSCLFAIYGIIVTTVLFYLIESMDWSGMEEISQ